MCLINFIGVNESDKKISDKKISNDKNDVRHHILRNKRW